MSTLVAICLPDRRRTARAVEQVWDDGDAVLVLDPTAPVEVTAALLAQVRPAALIETGGAGTRRTRQPDPRSVPDGTTAVVMTSGSTGAPRPVVISRRALDASARASLRRLGCGPGQRWLGSLPLHHVAGLSVLARSALLGTAPVLHEGFDVTRVAGSDASWWPLVPTMLARLLDARVDLSGRHILLGGGAVAAQTVTAARAAGAQVTAGYGMTETCGGCVYDGVPLDGVEVRIEAGRIQLRGAVLADGILTPDGAIQDLRGADGWLTTADVGRVSAGRLRVDGRADHVIVTGGENVAAEAVEHSLNAHPDVVMAGVVGIDDPEWGQRVVVLVVPRDRGAPPTLEHVRDHVGRRLGRHAAPQTLWVVDDLPTTALGKLARADLARLAATFEHANGPSRPNHST